MDRVICIIPVRLESERYNGKALSIYKGKTLIEHAILNAKKLDFVNKIVIASGDDNSLIKHICKENDIDFLYQEEQYSCGTERILGVRKQYPGFETFMTIPIDEPSIDPLEINRVYEKYNPFIGIATLYSDFYNEVDVFNSNSCKIVMTGDKVNYTSRATIPSNKSGGFSGDLSDYRRHVGVFFISISLLSTFGESLWIGDETSKIESLEQNNFLIDGLYAYKIKHNGFGIDIGSDNRRLEERMVEVLIRKK